MLKEEPSERRREANSNAGMAKKRLLCPRKVQDKKTKCDRGKREEREPRGQREERAEEDEKRALKLPPENGQDWARRRRPIPNFRPKCRPGQTVQKVLPPEKSIWIWGFRAIVYSWTVLTSFHLIFQLLTRATSGLRGILKTGREPKRKRGRESWGQKRDEAS